MLKWIRRIVLSLLALVLVAALALVAVIAVDSAGMAGRLDPLTNTSIPGAGGAGIRAYVARPSGPGPHPAVIMIHEFWGIRPEILGKADDLAARGYVVVVPDMFRGRTTSLVPSAIYNVISHPPVQVDADLADVFAWLAAQPDVQADRIAASGFCFGGGSAIRFATAEPRLAATVVFYGSPVTDADRLRALRGPVLGIFGGADTSIPLEEVRAFEDGLRTAGVSHEITIYDGQPHAFVTDMDAVRAGGPQGEAWAQFTRFLDEALKTTADDGRPTADGGRPTADGGRPTADDGRPTAYPIDFAYVVRLAASHATSHSH
jgi:carboxymethylenebutenolidase